MGDNFKNFLSRRLLEGSLKIMEGENGGAFYAKYEFDAQTGIGCIILLLEYPDGAVVGIPLCKNVCREISVEGNVIGKWAAPIQKELRFSVGPQFYPEKHHRAGQGGGSKADYESFIKYERPDFKIPIKNIWSRICYLWNKLPITTCYQGVTLEEVYSMLLEIGESKAEENEVYKDDTGVYLTKSEIQEVGNYMGIDFVDIRRIFENRNLWIKDKGSSGYQFSKKIDGKKQNFYKLRKISGNEEVHINKEHCIAYQEDAK